MEHIESHGMEHIRVTWNGAYKESHGVEHIKSHMEWSM